jgi:hypothetical protein
VEKLLSQRMFACYGQNQKVPSKAETFAKIEKITAEGINEIAFNELFKNKK